MNDVDWEEYKVARNQLGRIVKKVVKRKETAEGCKTASNMWSRCK